VKTFAARDATFEERVRASFAKQAAMHTLGVSVVRIEPGEVELSFDFREDLTQQHGFLHAGVITSAIDSACGYAALTLMEPGTAVLSVEFKVNLLTPARGRHFRAIGRVVRDGRNLTVVSGECRAYESADATGEHAVVAILTGTMMSVRGRPDLAD
jgi:uncharacterized protein (TIGR00369 family)